jgi:hypothetical protein
MSLGVDLARPAGYAVTRALELPLPGKGDIDPAFLTRNFISGREAAGVRLIPVHDAQHMWHSARRRPLGCIRTSAACRRHRHSDEAVTMEI